MCQGSLQYTVRAGVYTGKCVYHYAVSLYKTKGDFAQQCQVTLDLFPCSCRRGWWMSLFHQAITFSLFAFIKEQVLKYVEWEWL